LEWRLQPSKNQEQSITDKVRKVVGVRLVGHTTAGVLDQGRQQEYFISIGSGLSAAATVVIASWSYCAADPMLL
jgi:hypothetical protein